MTFTGQAGREADTGAFMVHDHDHKGTDIMSGNRKDAENYLRKKNFVYGPTVTFGSFCGEDGVERPLEWKVIGV